MRRITTALVSGLLVLGFAVALTPPASANDIGCGGETVEVCAPVCVTEPCPPYVCIHPPRYVGSVCQTLG